MSSFLELIFNIDVSDPEHRCVGAIFDPFGTVTAV
jgi:hypothetical protein